MDKLRIGIIGWATRTGLGTMNADMFDLGFADAWLVVRHPKLGVDECVIKRPSAVTVTDVRSSLRTVDLFLSGLQALIYAERPVLEGVDIVTECRRRNILTCCIPMLEWLPMPDQRTWVPQTDIMWATSAWCSRILTDLAAKYRRRGHPCRWEQAIVGDRWGVNLSRFPFRLRERCERFLFANGFGGAHERRGASVVQQIAKLMPQSKFLVLSQRDNLPDMPANCEVITENFEDAARIYRDGDLFLAPSRWEGLGLTLLESQACGLPLAATAGAPMDEAKPAISLPCTTSSVVMRHSTITSHEVLPVQAADILREWQGADLAKTSQAARQKIETQYNLMNTFRDMRQTLANHCGLLVKRKTSWR